MEKSRIDLHIRRPRDLGTLGPIRDALLHRGADALLTFDPRGVPLPPDGAVPGPARSDVRVILAGPGATPRDQGVRLVAIEGEMRGAEDPVPREIRDADLVLVAGLARARTLARELSNRVVPTGLPVLDDVLSDRATCRRRVRQRLGLSEEAQVVVLDPGFDPASSALVRLGDGIVALSAIGLTLLVPCSEDMGSWGVQMAQLGRHLPSLHVEEGLSLEDALAASDVIVGSTGPFTRAGAAMGWPVALVDPAKPDDGGSPIVDGTVVHAETLDEILSVVPSLLTRSEAPSSLGADLLRRGGGAAERAAEAILEGWSQEGDAPRGGSVLPVRGARRLRENRRGRPATERPPREEPECARTPAARELPPKGGEARGGGGGDRAG